MSGHTHVCGFQYSLTTVRMSSLMKLCALWYKPVTIMSVIDMDGSDVDLMFYTYRCLTTMM